MTLKTVMNADITNVFLNPNDFADDDGFLFSRTAAIVNAIFDNEFAVILDDIETSKPAISVKDTDVPGMLHDDTFTRILDGVVYKVIGIQPDGSGMTLVVLSQD
jgi:hypothetical protein